MATLKALLVFVAGIAATYACGRTPNPDKPAFCGTNDCPKFDVVETTDDFEVRRYEATKWVSTEMTGMDYDAAGREGFYRLFAYISGANTAGQKIAMTVPVIMKVTDNSDTMTVSFFIPFDHQDNPPAPSEENVFIDEVPEHEVYVRSFSGYADHSEYSTEAMALKGSLQQTSSSFQDGVYFTAGYDAPFKPFNRHNEVMIMKV